MNMAKDRKKAEEAWEKLQKEKAPETEAEAQPKEQQGGEAKEAEQGPAGQEKGGEEQRAALEAAVKQRDEYLQLAQRVQADFDNFRRRNSQTRADAYQDGVRETVAALLPVVDHLERALNAAQTHGDGDGLKAGVEMTLKQMLDILGKMGLSEIPALGENFDPEVHNAVMRVEEGEPGTVLEVFEKGYRIKDRVIRYAMVKVAAE